MLRSRCRSRVRFGFWSTAVRMCEPSSTKTIGTRCGRPSPSTVASPGLTDQRAHLDRGELHYEPRVQPRAHLRQTQIAATTAEGIATPRIERCP